MQNCVQMNAYLILRMINQKKILGEDSYMRICSFSFLLSYAIYIVFSFILVFIFDDNDPIVTSMVLAISSTSALFSIAEFVYIIFDSKRKIALEYLYNLRLNLYFEKKYQRKIEYDYEEKARELVKTFENVLGEEIFSKEKIEKEDRKRYINQINDAQISDDEKMKLMNYLEKLCDNDMRISDYEIYSIFLAEEARKMNKWAICLSTILCVIGLLTLLMIITIKFQVSMKTSNVITILAFLVVIVSMLYKEYNRKELEEIYNDRKELMNIEKY